MPNPSIKLWIDSENGKIMSSWQSLSTIEQLYFKQGDSVAIELHKVSINNGVMREIEFPSEINIQLAIGSPDVAPNGGSFVLSYNGENTEAILIPATASSVENALNALTSITSDGGVTVTQVVNSYRIIWNDFGVPVSQITTGSNDCVPECSIGIATVKAGGLTTKNQINVHIKQSPIANVSSFINQDDATASVSVVHTSEFEGDAKIWRIKISPDPMSGSFLISFQNGLNQYRTTPISVTESAEDVKTLLTSQFDANWYVNKVSNYIWDISTQLTSVFNVQVNGSGIKSFKSKYGILNLNTIGVEDLVAGSTSASSFLEIETFSNGVRETILQVPCTIYNDIIDQDSYTLVEFGEVMPVDSVVRYDTSQALTESQKLQARNNIGANTVDEFITLTNKDIELEGRIGTLEGKTLTTNQKQALDAATTLSATDKVVANSVLTTALTTKANTSHTHVIENVTGLQTELDDKAPLIHVHSIVDVTGLYDELLTKITDSPSDNLAYFRSNGSWTAFTPIQDVPNDSLAYYRINGNWQTFSPFDDVLNDNNSYYRKNKAWVQFTPLDDAPANNNYYVRRNNIWVQCTVFASGGKNYLTV